MQRHVRKCQSSPPETTQPALIQEVALRRMSSMGGSETSCPWKRGCWSRQQDEDADACLPTPLWQVLDSRRCLGADGADTPTDGGSGALGFVDVPEDQR